MCKAYGGGVDVPKALTKPVTHLENWKGLKTSCKYSPKRPMIYLRGQEMDVRSFVVQGIDDEFNFLLKGGLDENRGSLSAKSENNKTPMIDVEPLSAVHPSNVIENIIDSDNTSSEEDELPPVGPFVSTYHEVSKVAGDASTPLDIDSDPDIHEFPSTRELKDDTDCHWVVVHVTHPSLKQYLRDISIEQLCDVHDGAYMRQAVLDNMLNSRTRELIYALHKARASCDAFQKREIKMDKAYTKLEKKCDEALFVLEEKKWVNYEQTLSFLRAKVESLDSERERLKTFEIQLLQEIDRLRQDKADVVAKVVLDAAMKLVHSDEMGVLVAKLFKESIIHGRCVTF
ncbi:hypothetical protein Tco_1339893 [Tanacetum coccineum]